MNNTMKWINAGAFLLMIAVNAAANLIPLGGNTTGGVSAAYPNLFTPAPYTFSIWGLIYLMMAMFVIDQFGFSKNSGYSILLRDKIGNLFVYSCLLNTLWIICWHYRMLFLSVLIIAVLLIILLTIRQKIDNMEAIQRLEKRPLGKMPLLTRISVCGFEIYLGWITAALLANVSVFLVSIGWNRFGLSDIFWTIVVLLAGTAIAIAYMFVNAWYLAGAAVTWAYIGILIRTIDSQSSNIGYPWLIITIFATICALILSLFCKFISSTESDQETI